jgi:hypothetical protein
MITIGSKVIDLLPPKTGKVADINPDNNSAFIIWHNQGGEIAPYADLIDCGDHWKIERSRN